MALLKVDVIEAGFPVASPGDFESVKQIAEEIRGATIAGLSRALEKDIESTAKALEKAEKPRIHVFLSTSKVHREHMVEKAKEEIIEMGAKAVSFARKLCDDVEFSPMDATRTEKDFLADVTREVIQAGATTVNIPDTVGYTIPEEFAQLIGYLKQNVDNINQAIISVHCHNDLGLAVSNSLAAVQADNKELTDKLSKANLEKYDTQIKELTDNLQTLAVDLKASEEVVASKNEEVEALQTQLTEVTEAFEKAQSELQDIEQKQKIEKRVAALVGAGLTQEDAEAKMEVFDSLTDDQFVVMVDTVASVKPEEVEEEVKAENLGTSNTCLLYTSPSPRDS